MRGEIEMNIGKLGTRKNSNFFFGWRGPLVMIFGGLGQEGHRGGGRGVGREPNGTGQWGPEGPYGRDGRGIQGREGMAAGRRARWQLLGWWGQEEGGGQMAGR